MLGEKRHTKRYVAYVLAAFAILVAIATLGTPVPLSTLTSVKFDNPLVASSDGSLTAIVDSDGRRLLILDDRYHLQRVVQFDQIDAPFEAATDVCVSDGVVYVSGITYAPDSSDIVKERVVSYEKNDPYPDVVYEITRPHALIPSIKALSPSYSSVVVAVCNADTLAGSDDYALADEALADEALADESSATLRFILASELGYEEFERESVKASSVFDAGLDTDRSTFVVLDLFGSLSGTTKEVQEALAGHVLTSVDVGIDGNIYATDEVSGGICRITNEGELEMVLEGEGFECVHVAEDVLIAIDRVNRRVVISDLKGTQTVELEKIACSRSLAAYTLIVWTCRTYLAVFFSVLVIRRVRASLASGHTETIGGFLASFAVLCAIALALASTSYDAFTSSRDVRAKEIGILADYLKTQSFSYAEAMERCNDRQAFRAQGQDLEDALQSLVDVINDSIYLTDASSKNDIGMYFALYGKDEQGVFLLYDSLMEYVIASEPTSKLEENHIQEAFTKGALPNALYDGTTLRDATRFRLVRIMSPDTGEVIGVLEIGSKVRSYESSFMRDLATRIVALLVGLFVVYLAYAELRACGECLLNYFKLRDEHHHDARAALTRPFNFLVIMLASIDAVMSTLIGRTLLVSTGLPATGILLALPAVMQGIGLALGHLIYAQLGSRVGGRRLLARGAVGLICAALLAAFVVWQRVFSFYCAAKLLLAMPLGLFTSMVYSLPRQARNKSLNLMAAGGVKRTDTSAAATGTILGGLLAQTLGQPWVYLLMAVVSVCVLVLVLSLFGPNSHPLEAARQHSEEERESLLQFFGNHHTQALILCVMLPSILASGYNSFLFPLYSAELGADASTISNMFVLGQLVVYVSINALDRIDESQGKWRVAMGAVLFLGVVFLLFSFNRSSVWAVAVIALVGVLCKASDAWKALWVGRAMRHGLPAGRGVGSMFATRSVLQVLQPLILGGLLSMSQQVLSTILGVFCLVCTLLFYVFTRHSKYA